MSESIQSPEWKLSTQPPQTKFCILDFPAPYVLLVTMNRERYANALSVEACWEMDKVWKWFDEEGELRVGIVTGTGTRAFSAGMDLRDFTSSASLNRTTSWKSFYPPSGFAGLTRRSGKKPIIAAINGHAHGGGFEIVLNSDLVLASSHATFRLPDVLRGTAGLEGGLPRLERIVGMQRAGFLALTGYTLTAEEARSWGLVCKVVEGGREALIKEAMDVAKMITGMSPDSVVVTRAGLRTSWELGSVEEAVERTGTEYGERLFKGENLKEGLDAFREKREPRWVASKL